jgi:hypothetical protein
MPYPNPLRFPVTTEDYDAVAVLEGDIEARKAAVADHRPALKAIAKALVGTSSPAWDANPGLWMTGRREDGFPAEVTVVVPGGKLDSVKADLPGTLDWKGREVGVIAADEDEFRRSIADGVFRFDDLFHLHMAYFEGHCHHFALAARLVTGQPLGVMWDDLEYADKETGVKEIAHVYLKLPGGKVYDYDGIRSEEEMQISIAGEWAHQTSCGDLRTSRLKDFIENGWLDEYDDELLLQALDVIALDPVLFRAIESIAPGRLAKVRADIAGDLGFEPEGERPWAWLPSEPADEYAQIPGR